METIKAAQITCTVYRSFTSKALGALKALGVREYHFQASRAVVLRRKAGFLGIGAGIGLEEQPADKIILHVPDGAAETVLQGLSAACGLHVPGHGSAVSEEVAVVAGSAWEAGLLTPLAGAEQIAVQGDLASITCTVQRGRGNNLVKAVLGLGMPMPQVTAGEGTGLRDKLGLIRVALPAEKDVVHAVVAGHEAADILGALIDAGRLDRFGAGFIYSSPLDRGVLNNMVIRGQRHSASIEQIIAAVDDLKGSPDWRKRALEGGEKGARKRSYLENLVNLTLVCNEGRASDLVHAAMAAGASGATISRLSHVRIDGAANSVSPAREISELIIGEGVVSAIVEALEGAGVFDGETAGTVALKPVSLAFTHQRGRR
ncbi:MAG: hypothetical protein HYW07_06950 [Candidatus Latescibacteria bacterium]|nr:hypothetical protein [Candidatus Latescibacterota bacterium]